MNLRNTITPRQPTKVVPATALTGSLFAPGDRVRIMADDERLYRIVHISDQKAWVCPLLDGTQQIIRTRELELVDAPASSGRLLS